MRHMLKFSTNKSTSILVRHKISALNAAYDFGIVLELTTCDFGIDCNSMSEVNEFSI